jgi:hypothetical protein
MKVEHAFHRRIPGKKLAKDLRFPDPARDQLGVL